MSRPLLWHLKVSHYNEKARWALDFKRVPHVRRPVTPGVHPLVARALTGAETLPILVLDGQRIADSTRIIAALEERVPDPPLYPSDPEQRRRALELEDHFDEELGPYTRMLAMHHALQDPDLFLGMFLPDLPAAGRALTKAVFPRLRAGVREEFGLTDDGMAHAREKVREAGARFRSEVGENGHLVGDTFTVADLTLAALLSPPGAPEQFPYPQPQRDHELFAPVRELFAEEGLLDWMRATYARWRYR